MYIYELSRNAYVGIQAFPFVYKIRQSPKYKAMA